VVFPAVAAILILCLMQTSRIYSTIDKVFTPVPVKEPEGVSAPGQEPAVIASSIQAVAPSPVSGESSSAAGMVYSKYEFDGLKGRITAAYKYGYRATGKTGIAMTPQTTLREYLTNVTPLLPDSNGRLGELTILTEIVLYSSFEPDEKMAARAETLARDIKT
jgi:hypothetical protein